MHYVDSIAAARRRLTDLEDLAALDSPVHRLDARAKTLVALLFALTAISFPKHAAGAIIPLVFFPVVVVARAGLPLRPILLWMIPALPLALLGGAANPWLDREIAGRIGGIAVTGGVLSLLSIVERVLLTALAGILLAATTPMNEVCRALERMGAPRPLTTQLWLMYRYTHVMIDEAGRIVRAHALRAQGRRIALPLAGPLAGQWLLRTIDRAQRIHTAMLCRGYDGRLPALRPSRWSAADTLWLAGWLIFFLVVRLVNIPAALGGLLAGAGG